LAIPAATRRSVQEYLDTLDKEAWGAASEVTPKFISKSDPAAQWTGAHKGHAFFAYSDNYLIDLKASIIMDVEPTRAIRQAEVGATKTMIERTEERFGLKPQRLAGDTAYGSAEILNWIVSEKNIAPHVALFDKSERTDGTFSLSDFTFDADANSYTCPAGKLLLQYRKRFSNHGPGSSKVIAGTTAPKDGTVRRVLSNQSVVQGPIRVSCPSACTRPRATSCGTCATRPNTFSPAASAKKSRCCSHISSAFCGSDDYDYEDLAVLAMSSPWPPSPRTSGNWPR